MCQTNMCIFKASVQRDLGLYNHVIPVTVIVMVGELVRYSNIGMFIK